MIVDNDVKLCAWFRDSIANFGPFTCVFLLVRLCNFRNYIAWVLFLYADRVYKDTIDGLVVPTALTSNSRKPQKAAEN
jgi:hypothetical protein